LRMTRAKKMRPKMTLAEITMPMTRGVMPLVDEPLLDASLVPEAEGDVEVWVTTVVDGSKEVVESGGVKRGAELVEEVVDREEVDETARALDEDEEMEVRTGREEADAVGWETEASDLVVEVGLAVVVGTAGFKMLEKKDSIGFWSSSADADVVGRSWRFGRACSIYICC
jgi:hypothetical protein